MGDRGIASGPGDPAAGQRAAASSATVDWGCNGRCAWIPKPAAGTWIDGSDQGDCAGIVVADAAVP